MVGSTDRFGYEWNKFNKITPDYEEQFLKWVTPLKKSDFKNKVILDAGCGTGRNSFWPLTYGAKEVYAIDFNQNTIKVAKKNLAKFKNALVVYKSVYDLDYKNKFDLSFCIGVIHHLENPELAIKKLVQSTKQGGQVLIWVYGYEGNEWVVNYITPLRKFTSYLPLSITNIISYFFSIPLFLFLKAVPQTNPYFKQLSTFKFWHLHSIVFDHLIPRIANYWTKDQAKKLLSDQNLKNIKINRVNNISWTVIGTKK